MFIKKLKGFQISPDRMNKFMSKNFEEQVKLVFPFITITKGAAVIKAMDQSMKRELDQQDKVYSLETHLKIL